MPKFISFDMDGTLIDPEFTDWVWGQGIPSLYGGKVGLPFEAAKAFVVREYEKVGEGAVEWYDIKYWFRLFQLEESWKELMKQYVDKIRVYPDVNHMLERLKERFPLVLTSNAGREFIEIEMEATGLGQYFHRIFSATSDFGVVKKTTEFYQQVCHLLNVGPEEIVHVGDHYDFDYLVPRKVGIQAYCLDRSGERRGEFVLRSLGELEEKLLVSTKHQAPNSK
jgi:HAD superfamily hydrolase (TIGR01549 family)